MVGDTAELLESAAGLSGLNCIPAGHPSLKDCFWLPKISSLEDDLPTGRVSSKEGDSWMS
jgi:hypothetical protein